MRARILNASAGSGKTYQAGIQIRAGRGRATHAVPSHPGRHVHQQGHRGDEIPHPVGDTYAGLGRQKAATWPACARRLSLDERTVRTRAREARTRILHDYSRFTILTIDTFFQRILRAFIQELGLDLNYNVEIETASVLSKSADALVEQIRIDEELQRWLTAFVQERIEDGKRWDVREGILALGNEIFKESNRETLSAERSKAELDRIVGKATGRAKAGKKGVSGIGRSGHEPHEYRWRHDGRLHRQEPQLRGLLRGRSRRRDQSTHSYRAQDERDDGRLVRQGLAGPAAGRGAFSRCWPNCAPVTTAASASGTPPTCCARTTAASPCCRTFTAKYGRCAATRT